MPRLICLTSPLVAAVALLTGCATAAGHTSQDADALRQALDDEYRAEATYAAVIEKFGEVRPFINIIQAEQRHSERAKAQMDRLDIAYDPVNPFIGTVRAPDTILAACEQGVDAEIENIALYDRLLPTLDDPQVLATLTDLQWASRERHLPAFRRCVARGGQMGPGHGHGQGHRN